ncbi:Phospholipid--sterol O-acyltransferase [Seminavis robusta]|uniref:Phospholipid--sterol O-acyltransferase n=1 Tax=Seminavis robusta TaxID=568900 RepID=A0A9N8EJL6_9STRA|nr:Phospholipid--sterol O-acyltransferase [Seminavis robusta]|eukprot:Sro1062_g237010.1 Phospholipid--sterol O-acyltransferase (910) ;mRNA; r:29507-32620
MHQILNLRHCLLCLFLVSSLAISLATAAAVADSQGEAIEGETSSTSAGAPKTTTEEIQDEIQDGASLQNATDNETVPQKLLDEIEDSFFDALSRDPSCDNEDCWAPPQSTLETSGEAKDSDTCDSQNMLDEASKKDVEQGQETCSPPGDKHWGSDPTILRMRDKLREAGSVGSSKKKDGTRQKSSEKTIPKNRRPPVFLIPGLASTRLIAWKFKSCPQHPLLSDIKVLDVAWLNINFVFQMGTFDSSCLKDCLSLGLNQTDTDDLETGCKLRPEEGLDAISSLSPSGFGSDLLVGGTNTVYAWLIQWLADNLGYDVTNVIGLPYDWRLSPDRMEGRDGFLTLTRRRIEAAVKSNGEPGIVVAHSMGNVVFRYFLEWLRQEMRHESYQQYLKRAERRAKKLNMQQPTQQGQAEGDPATVLPGWMSGVVTGFDEWWSAYFSARESIGGNEESTDADGRHPQLWELAKIEGDGNWIDWVEEHIWTYVGLSAPLLGAINPLRAVLSGENMGLPISDEVAREMELTFGSTHSVNPVSSKSGFCDQWDVNEWGEEPSKTEKSPAHSKLACLDDIFNEIEFGNHGDDPWENYPALKSLMKERIDWDTDSPMVEITIEECKTKGRQPCETKNSTSLTARDSETGEIFNTFNRIWKERDEPMIVKREQLEESFWNTRVPNILNHTWERPLIKHVIMAYGVDIPTEVGYKYRKKESPTQDQEEYDGVPHLEQVIVEQAHGELFTEALDATRGGLADLLKKRKKRERFGESSLHHSGDGSVPYLSLSWAHVWLFHAARAARHSGSEDVASGNPLEDIVVSHRPKGAMEWVDGAPPKQSNHEEKKTVESDTGTNHPHGTKYKPEMHRFHNVGKSRTTGIEYTTTVIEALGVEHKETTRNYDILAAVFTDVLRNMHDDFGLV